MGSNAKYGEFDDRSESHSGLLFLRQKDPFGELHILGKFQRVNIFVKFRKVPNASQSTKMADGIDAKLYIFNRPVHTERRELASF